MERYMQPERLRIDPSSPDADKTYIGIEHFLTLLTPCLYHEEKQRDHLQGLRSPNLIY